MNEKMIITGLHAGLIADGQSLEDHILEAKCEWISAKEVSSSFWCYRTDSSRFPSFFVTESSLYDSQSSSFVDKSEYITSTDDLELLTDARFYYVLLLLSRMRFPKDEARYECCIQFSPFSSAINDLSYETFKEIPDSDAAFFSDGRYWGTEENVRIPSSVAVEENAFLNNIFLKHLLVSEDILEIGANAFRSCWNLKLAVLPGSVQLIGDYAFSDCRALEMIILSCYTSIGFHAFLNSSRSDKPLVLRFYGIKIPSGLPACISGASLAALQEAISEGVNHLTEIEKKALWLNYGLGGKEYRIRSVGKAMRLSEEEGAAILSLALKKIFSDDWDQDSFEFAQKYQRLGDAQYEVKKYSTAEETYQSALEYWKKALMDAFPDQAKEGYANCLLKLAKAKSNSGSSRGYDEIKEAISLCEEIAENSESTTARSILARGYFYLGQLMKALSPEQEKYFYKARDLCEFCVRKNHLEADYRLLIDLYMSIADFYIFETDQYLIACERAKRVSEELVEKWHYTIDRRVLANIYENMALRIVDTEYDNEENDLSVAENLLKEAISLYTPLLGAFDHSLVEFGLIHCYSYLYAIQERNGTLEKTEEECEAEYNQLKALIKKKQEESYQGDEKE